jgi:hypothetical protein
MIGELVLRSQSMTELVNNVNSNHSQLLQDLREMRSADAAAQQSLIDALVAQRTPNEQIAAWMEQTRDTQDANTKAAFEMAVNFLQMQQATFASVIAENQATRQYRRAAEEGATAIAVGADHEYARRK